VSSRGFGVAAGLDAEVAGPLAARCEQLGYRSCWSNDHPGAKGLGTLADFAEGTSSADLGVAGFQDRPLTAMRAALPALREALPGVRLVLAAMGPKMCSLAGAEFDGAFFNWMTAAYAAKAREWVEAGARDAGRETPPVMGYVRVAVGADARERLIKEESFYRDLHDGYRGHFERLGEPEGTVGVAAADREEAQRALAEYEAYDVVVVRGLASANLEAMSAVAEAAAP